MRFVLVGILNKMENLFKSPRNKKRFEDYLFMLQGDKKEEMILPIAGYNPMGKELVLQKIRELKELNAEKVIENELVKINRKIKEKSNRKIEVVLNLADDIGGAWSNFYTTDYSTKFELGALLKRNFCTPYFWTSEEYTEELITQRANEYVYRTLFWITHKKPISLEDHLEQEVFVQISVNKFNDGSDSKDYSETEKFYLKHLKSEEYNLIFNFFYGDEASKSLEYPTFGVKEPTGFEYAKFIASKRKAS